MKLLRISQVKAVFGYKSNTSIYGLIHQGLFPRPVPIQKRSVGWPESEVTAICKARIAERTDEQIRSLVRQLHNDRGLLALES